MAVQSAVACALGQEKDRDPASRLSVKCEGGVLRDKSSPRTEMGHVPPQSP